MLRGEDIVGKAVVLQTTGEVIHKVKDLVFDYQRNQVIAFVVDEVGWRNGAKVLPWSGVQEVRPNSVVARSRNMIVEARQLFEVKQMLHRQRIVRGTRILTVDGQDLGTVQSIYFDSHTGTIEGYEVMGGLFAADGGRIFLPAPRLLRLDKDQAVVPTQTVEFLNEPPGLQGGLLPGSGKQRDSKNWTTKWLHQAKQAEGLKWTEFSDEVIENVHGKFGGALKSASRADEQAQGRRAAYEVRTPEGWVVVAAGQIVTPRVIDRARRYHQERELLKAVGILTEDAPHNALKVSD